jgi:transcriptional regulator with AAA-type ATPase domain
MVQFYEAELFGLFSGLFTGSNKGRLASFLSLRAERPPLA